MITSNPSENVDRLWEPEHVRAFLSHTSKYKAQAAGAKNELRKYGISAFVAHEDIKPTRLWQDEIICALDSMDLIIPILTPDFPDSDWTSQEIGYALGRRIPMIPIRYGLDPYGFIAQYQALSWGGGHGSELASKIFECLMNSEADGFGEIATTAYVQAVVNAPNYAEANWLSLRLPTDKGWSPEKIDALIQAFNDNDQVKNSHGFQKDLPPYLEQVTGDSYVFVEGDPYQWPKLERRAMRPRVGYVDANGDWYA